MLVLSRKRTESIVIGSNIVVTVVQCTGQTVRLGITAPREVPVYRQEVLQGQTCSGSQLPVEREHDNAALRGEVN